MKHAEKKVSKTVYLKSVETKKQNKLLPFIFQFLLLYMGLSGFIYCVATSVNMPISLGRIALICFPSLLISALFTVNKKAYIVFISIFGGTVFCVLFLIRSLRDRIFEAFVFCYNLTIKIVVDEGYTNYLSAMTEDITQRLAEPGLAEGYFYCVVVVLSIVFSVIFTSAMIKKSFVWICVLPCFLVLTPSLFFGAVPSGGAFCLFLSGLVGFYVESIAYKLYKSSAKKNGTDINKNNNVNYSLRCSVNGFCCAVVILAVSLCVSSVVYTKDVMQIENVRKVLDNVAVKMMNNLFYDKYENSDGAIGGLLYGNSLELKTPKFRGLPVMTVTTFTNNSLYLRGWIGDELTDKGWLILDGNDTKEYENAVGDSFDQYTQLYKYTKLVSEKEMRSAQTPSETAKLGFVYDTVTVKAKFTKSLMAFVPVTGINGDIVGKYRGVNTIGDKISFFKDKRPSENTYTIDAALQNFSDHDFYKNFKEKRKNYLLMANEARAKQYGLSEEEQFMYDERRYSDYVKSAYMSMPENAEFLEELAQELTKKYDDSFDKALALERYFKTNYTYAESFIHDSGTPVDKVRYMINTSKTGYCTYYATAMTLMLRSLKIPARYVTGYHAMASPKTNLKKYTREISDENYHAWVEVYFDGIGWLTFDPTPGINGEQSIINYAFLDEPELGTEQKVHETEEKLPTAEENTVKKDENEKEEEKEKENEIKETEEAPIIVKKMPVWIAVLIVILSVIVFVAVMCALTVVLINHRFNAYMQKLHMKKPTEQTRALYPNILRLLGSLGYRPENGESLHDFAGRVDDEFKISIRLSSIIDIMEMTQFSENTVSEADAGKVSEYFDRLSISVFYRHNIFKKYYYMATIKKKKY